MKIFLKYKDNPNKGAAILCIYRGLYKVARNKIETEITLNKELDLFPLLEKLYRKYWEKICTRYEAKILKYQNNIPISHTDILRELLLRGFVHIDDILGEIEFWYTLADTYKVSWPKPLTLTEVEELTITHFPKFLI